MVLSPQTTDPRPGPRDEPEYQVIVMGAGFGGLGTGVELRKRGIDSFLILEKHPDIGGTWYANTYPGVAVDIPSLAYSFSYEKPKQWSHMFARGAEVKAYADQIADKYRLRRHLRCDAEIVRADWDEDRHTWTVTLANGEQLTARFIVNALGGLEVPNNPNIDGIDSFAGKTVHTARWDHDFDYRGKRIGVIGTGASALQLVPEMAKIAGHLTVFQRRPIWVAAKPDFRVDRGVKQAFDYVPGLRRAARLAIGLGLEGVYGWMWSPYTTPVLEKVSSALGRSYHKQLPDHPELADKLTPDYIFGCKRPSLSSDYIKTYGLPHVTLVTEGIDKITPDGVVSVDGTLHELDVLVTATGFKLFEKGVTPPFPITGKHGVELGDFWDRHRYQAYQGVSVPGFPNLFTLIGPYALSGLSYLAALECTSGHAARAIDRGLRIGATEVEVKQEPHDKFHATMIKRTHRAVFKGPRCATSNTYYVNSHGDVPTFRPSAQLEIWWGNRHFPFSDYAWRRLPATVTAGR